MGRLIVAGIGPGASRYVVPEVDVWVKQAQLLVGGQRALDLFPNFNGKTLRITRDYRELFPEISLSLSAGQIVVVLVSGDPGIFSLLDSLQREFAEQITVIPGISSIQTAAARLQTTWNDATILSTHHQLPENLVQELCTKEKFFILTGPVYDSVYILECLIEQEILDCRIALCADLSSLQEKVIQVELASLSMVELENLKLELAQFKHRLVVFYLEKTSVSKLLPFRSGLGDQEFLRGTIPMTKEEIRAISLSKLDIRPDSVVYDVGAGTGSISIQAAMFAPQGIVYAIEHNPAALCLIRENVRRFSLHNIVVMEGTAPACFPEAKADAIFLGGTGGYLVDLFHASLEKLKQQGRMVINAVTMDTITQMWDLVQQHPELKTEVILVQISALEQRGQAQVWNGRNPIYIFTLERK